VDVLRGEVNVLCGCTLGTLKGWVRQMARPESCIAEGYITHEAMKLAQEYCTGLDPKWASIWVSDDDQKLYGQDLPKAHLERVMSDVVYEQAHRFVLLNHPCMAPWMERYEATLQGTLRVPPFKHWVRGAVMEAFNSGDYINQDVMDISAGPNVKAKYFSGTFVTQTHQCYMFGNGHGMGTLSMFVLKEENYFFHNE
jgi:hypothetical protein